MGDILVVAHIDRSPETDLWQYRVVNQSGMGMRDIAHGSGYDSDYAALVGLVGFAEKTGLKLGQAFSGQSEPDYRERRETFTRLLSELENNRHPATAFIRRDYHDTTLIRAVIRHFAQMRAGGLKEIQSVYTAAGGSLAALAVATFADMDELQKITASESGLHARVIEKASEYLWLTEGQARAFFLHQLFSTQFETRLADGHVSFADTLKVWRHYLHSGEMTWEIVAPKPADMMKKIIINSANIENTHYCEANRLAEKAATERAEKLGDLAAEAAEYTEKSGDLIYDCAVYDGSIRLLAENPTGRVRWKKFA